MAKKYPKKCSNNRKCSKGGNMDGRTSDRSARSKRDGVHPIDREVDRSMLMDVHKSSPNDWRWYAMNEQLLKDTASLPYSWPLGNRLRLDDSDSNPLNLGSVPGIMVLKTAPAYGVSATADSPINVASRKIYTYVRHENSGGKNYDPVDLMLYLMSMDGALSYLSWLKRLYGTINLYNFTNRYFPKAAIVAQNVDYDDLIAHIADFRAYINTFAVRVGALCIPNSIAYMAKHSWMYSGMYLDGQNDKAQVYMFAPSTYSVFGLDADGAGCLRNYNLWGFNGDEPQKSWTRRLTYGDLRKTGEAILAPLINSEDCGIISGDILKAYGQSGVYQADGIREDYTVLPVYDNTVLDQIHNATTVGELYSRQSSPSAENTSMILKQDPTKGWLVFDPTFYNQDLTYNTKGKNSALGRKFVNFDHDNITPAETMEATRMMNIPASIDASTGATKFMSLGSEVVLNFAIYNFEYSNNNWHVAGSDELYTYTNFDLRCVITTDSATNKNNLDSMWRDHAKNLKLVTQLTQFDRHPAVYISQTGYCMWNTAAGPTDDYTDNKTNGVWGILQDLGCYAIVDINTLANMDMTALLSEFFTRNAGEV